MVSNQLYFFIKYGNSYINRHKQVTFRVCALLQINVPTKIGMYVIIITSYYFQYANQG